MNPKLQSIPLIPIESWHGTPITDFAEAQRRVFWWRQISSKRGAK